MESRISDNKRRNIAKAREFASKCISGKTNAYSLDDYYTLQISKFLLLKESIIKKNPQTSIIHFDYLKHKDYLESIRKIVKLFDTDKLVLNNITVSIEPKEYETDELKRTILIFHKIRDALAHGAYEIDIDSQEIVIFNNSDVNGNSYHIEGRIHVSLLEEFTYIGLSPEIIKIIINEEQKLFNVNINKDIFMKNNKLALQKEGQIYDDIYKNVNFYKEDYDNLDINYKKALKVVKALLQFINNSVSINDKTKKKAQELASKVLNNTDYKDALDGIDKDLAKLKKIRELIDELCHILKTSKNEIGTKNVAIYNYIQMYLSNCLELTDEQKRKIGFLRLKDLKCDFIRNNDIDNQIKGAIRLILRQYRKRLRQYLNNPDRNSFYNLLVDFRDATINTVLPLLQSRNVWIITNIRNAVDHGNITFDGDNVKLTDTNDLSTDKFTCNCTSDQLFRVINDLDTAKEEDLEYDELSILCSELEPILSSEPSLYKDFYETVRFYYRNRVIKQLEEVKKQK